MKLLRRRKTLLAKPLLLTGDNIDFMIHGLFSYKLFGHEVWITNSHVCILIVMLILIGFAFAANRAFAGADCMEAPSGFRNFVELIIELLSKMVEGSMGKAAPRYFNYLATIFMFILLSNISGLLGLRPPTADYGTTFPLGVITFCLIHFAQFKHNSLKDIWTDMCSPLPPWLPIWFPINLISEFAVPISLSLRLFANVLSGTVIMALVYGLLSTIAVAWPSVLHIYFDLFSGCIQTYVFTMLTMTYISQQVGDK